MPRSDRQKNAPHARRRLTAATLAVAVALATLVIAPVSSVLSAQPASAAAKICHSTVFRSVPSKHVWYRVPSVVKSPMTKIVYAFAERRNSATVDTGNFDVAMATSKDNGCTWSKPRVVANHGNDRVSSPTAIVSKTGQVFLFVSARYSVAGRTLNHLYQLSSANDFRSMKEVVFPYSSGLAGPSHGITLTKGSHAGRMVFPIGFVDRTGHYGVVLAYSDDNGAHWTSGAPAFAPKGIKVIEPSIVQRYDGNIMVSLRDSALVSGHYKSAPHTRWYSLSSNGGRSLSTIKSGHAPSIVSVQASMIEPASGTYSHDLFFVAPAQRTPGQPETRRDASVFLSKTRGATWHAPHDLERTNTPAAYSDVTQIDASTFGIVYEGGAHSAKEVIKYESVRISSLVR